MGSDDLKRVGLVFKADGAVDFKKTIQQVNDAIQENRNSFKLAKTSWDDSTSAMDKLQDRQKYLAAQTAAYSYKVKILEEELKELEGAEERNEQAIQKKRNQLSSTKVALINYQKGLEDVEKQIKSGSAVMAEEMKRLDGTLDTLSASAKENETAFNLVKAKWDDGTKAAQKLKDEQKYLENQTKNYGEQVETLERQLQMLESAEEKNEKAIHEKRSELNQARTSLTSYRRELEDVNQNLNRGTANIREYAEKLDDFGEKTKTVGDKLSGISAAAAGIAAAAAATVPATEEYRRIMASLESSSELAGYSAEQTAQTYRQLFGVLGDDQTAATTTANLQALGFEQDRLTKLVDGTVGAWARYGDSIPIDGLAESINETVKAGSVTGTFADVLNWAGTSEDLFNERLEACGSEAERANLVMQELAEQGLMEAGQKWQKNNQTIVEGNQATADFQAATAELAETIAPIITRITEIMAGLLEKFNALPPSTQEIIAVIILLIAAIAPLITAFGTTASGISKIITLSSKFVAIAMKVPGILSTVGTGANVLWTIMKANPLGAVVTVLSLLAAAFVTAYEKCDWFREKVDEMIASVKKALSGVTAALKDFFSLGSTNIKVSSSFGKISLPKLKMSWYAKGGILNKPTIFGKNGDSFLGGGEAGKEAVLPIDLLKQYIREENNANNAILADTLLGALSEIKVSAENNIYIGDRKFFDVISEMVVDKIGNRQSGKRLAMGVW